MSSRSYLSIGDVLTLLRQEFPDVTISKIRFLESQGLVNPERTPSGYRKFYEHDVERLRWVLRQQRENFLPLKVIKDRLDDEQAEAGTSASGTSGHSPQQAEEPVLVGQRTSAGHQDATTHREPAAGGGGPVAARSIGAPLAHAEGPSAADGPTLPGIEAETNGTNGSATKAGAGSTHSTPAAPTMPTAPTRAEAPDDVPPTPTATASPSTPVKPPVEATRARAAKGDVRGGPQAKVPAPGPAAQAVAEPDGKSAAAREIAPPATDSPISEAADQPAGRSGASLSVEEVASASGLEPSVVEQLVEYGLLTSIRVAGLPCFDQEAVAVATLAAGFARFGIEPRHLRLYKNTADREVGFVEQIVLPLVRQRNPEARVRATETADELVRLGQQLRASLVRSALGALLDG